MGRFLVVTTTFTTKEEALEISERLLKERLVACAQISKEVKSIYWWKGEVVTSDEYVLTLKSTEDAYPQLENLVKKLHSYDTPEIIGVPITHVESEYSKWMYEEVNPGSK